MKESAKRIGVGKLVPHDLRRTCARLCHASGGELSRSNFSWGMFRCRRPNVTLAANGGFHQPSMIVSTATDTTSRASERTSRSDSASKSQYTGVDSRKTQPTLGHGFQLSVVSSCVTTAANIPAAQDLACQLRFRPESYAVYRSAVPDPPISAHAANADEVEPWWGCLRRNWL